MDEFQSYLLIGTGIVMTVTFGVRWVTLTRKRRALEKEIADTLVRINRAAATQVNSLDKDLQEKPTAPITKEEEKSVQELKEWLK